MKTFAVEMVKRATLFVQAESLKDIEAIDSLDLNDAATDLVDDGWEAGESLEVDPRDAEEGGGVSHKIIKGELLALDDDPDEGEDEEDEEDAEDSEPRAPEPDTRTLPLPFPSGPEAPEPSPPPEPPTPSAPPTDAQVRACLRLRAAAREVIDASCSGPGWRWRSIYLSASRTETAEDWCRQGELRERLGLARYHPLGDTDRWNHMVLRRGPVTVHLVYPRDARDLTDEVLSDACEALALVKGETVESVRARLLQG